MEMAASAPRQTSHLGPPPRSATHTRNHRERAQASMTQKQKLLRPEPLGGQAPGAGQGRPPTPSTPEGGSRENRCQDAVSLCQLLALALSGH